MRLVVGLGNPGDKYAKTLHNVGFWAIDQTAQQFHVGSPLEKFQSRFHKISLENSQAFLLKPLSFMNLSGSVVGNFSRYFRIAPEDILVIADDINLPPGKLRYRQSGGHGGHNGLRNIIEHIGDAFHRIRIGVGKPTDSAQLANYVLSSPSVSDSQAINGAVSAVPEYIIQFLKHRPVEIVG